MKSYFLLLFFLIPCFSYAQITSSVTSDRADYVYGEIIKITMTISNNSEDELVTYQGSGTLRTVVRSFSGIELLPDIVTTDDFRDTIHVGETREVRWQLDPSELALPQKDGEQTVIVRALSVVDSVKFNAPKFIGGEVFLYFEEETEMEKINHLRDSLGVRVIEEDHPGYTWYLREFMADSVISKLIKRDYVLEAFVPARQDVRAISHRTITETEKTGDIPTFSLDQNYPNPFNPTTKISFNLEQASFVELGIYDLMGRKVKELTNRRYLQGYHSVLFDATDFSSGTYIYQLKTNSGTISKKLTLIK